MRLRTSLACVLVAAAAVVISTPAALAQTGATQASKQVRPPDPGNPTPPNLVVIYLLLIALFGGAVGLSIMPSQRTHQD